MTAFITPTGTPELCEHQRLTFQMPVQSLFKGLLLSLALLSHWVSAEVEAVAALGADIAPPSSLPVTVPLELDYPLLERLLVTQMFTGAEQSLEVLNDPSGCSEVLLSEPQLRSADSMLELVTEINTRIGLGSAGNCTTLLAWEGKIGINGIPEIRNDGTALGFSPERVWLMNPTGQTVNNAQLQALAETSVRNSFAGFTVDLLPQMQSIEEFLPAVLPQHSKEQIEALLNTLRVSTLQTTDETLNANIVFTVESLASPLEPERALSDDELARWEERWQLMDSLLVLTVKHYAAETQLQSLRDALLEVLIESRYRLRDALIETPNTGADEDVVRDWFLQSWQALAPVIRNIGEEQPGQEHLLLISIIAATDALEALDQLGPSVGLDISADGLRRLARMINGSTGDNLLIYSEDLDPELRQLFEDSFNTTAPPTSWRLNLSLFPEAVAADDNRLNSWAPQRQDLPEYLPLVARLMKTSTDDAIASRKLDSAYGELFRRLVLTTAWQESCWRHYTVSKDRKLVPMRSGTGDVGLMQINERVWRGFYDQQRLRWDIDYNSKAGAEILIDYLIKYAIRKGEHQQPGGLTNLARSSYSAYNGGPSKVARYRSSKASAYGKKVDAAFWAKYQQVASGNELAVSTCLGGDLSGPAIKGTSATAANRSAAPSQSSDPPASWFTLQLGVFSTAEAAQSFVDQQNLDGRASVRQRRKGDRGQFLVISGGYETRSQAETAKRSLVKFQPWIRQFADL
ncbi:SPOR domain-containing protein [Congregibacter sp.]|uniref:SPOR domain-containing protein n=1 Tax=Congregibacter sp. TaxID=2744308 RepID=UPI003F6D0EF4